MQNIQNALEIRRPAAKKNSEYIYIYGWIYKNLMGTTNQKKKKKKTTIDTHLKWKKKPNTILKLVIKS